MKFISSQSEVSDDICGEQLIRMAMSSIYWYKSASTSGLPFSSCCINPKSGEIRGQAKSGTNQTPAGNGTRKSGIDKVGHSQVIRGVPVTAM